MLINAGITTSLLIIVESATLATMTMLVAAEKPPINARMVSQVCPPCMGRASTKASPLNSPVGSTVSPASVIGMTNAEKTSKYSGNARRIGRILASS